MESGGGVNVITPGQAFVLKSSALLAPNWSDPIERPGQSSGRPPWRAACHSRGMLRRPSFFFAALLLTGCGMDADEIDSVDSNQTTGLAQFQGDYTLLPKQDPECWTSASVKVFGSSAADVTANEKDGTSRTAKFVRINGGGPVAVVDPGSSTTQGCTATFDGSRVLRRVCTSNFAGLNVTRDFGLTLSGDQLEIAFRQGTATAPGTPLRCTMKRAPGSIVPPPPPPNGAFPTKIADLRKCGPTDCLWVYPFEQGSVLDRKDFGLSDDKKKAKIAATLKSAFDSAKVLERKPAGIKIRLVTPPTANDVQLTNGRVEVTLRVNMIPEIWVMRALVDKFIFPVGWSDLRFELCPGFDDSASVGGCPRMQDSDLLPF
jgi:hypothetical protein